MGTISGILRVSDVLMVVLGVVLIGVAVWCRVVQSRSKFLQCAPTFTLVANLANLAVLQWDIWMRYFGEHVSCATMAIVEWSIGAVGLHCWLVIALALFSAFNQAQDRIDLMDRGISDAKRSEIIRRLKIYTKLLDRRNHIYYIVGCTLFIQIPFQIIVAFIFPDTRKTAFSDVNKLEGFQFIFLELSGAAFVGFDCMLLLRLAFKSRIVVDSLGVKSMLISVGKCLGTSMVIYFVLQLLLAVVAPYASHFGRALVVYYFTVSVFLASVALPLYRAGGGLLGTEGTGFSSERENHLQAFLRISKYSEAFRKHLQSEYSVENLQFWLEVDEFQRRFGPGSPESGNFRGRNEAGLEIYRMFLCKGALQEVNLPSNILNSFRDDIFSSVDGSGEATVVPDDAISFLQCPHDVFMEAKECIFDLLQKDSFPRFLKKEENAKLWNEFIQREKESNVMMSLHTHTMLRKSGGRSGISSMKTGTSVSIADTSSMHY